MGLLDKAKAAAEQAAAKAKEGVEDVQSKRELSQLYGELGRLTYGLVDRGELSDSRLTALVERIRGVEASDGSPASTSAEPAPSNQPPAMPN